MISVVINYFRRIKYIQSLKTLDNCRTLSDLALYSIKKNKLKQFSFLEIGVFKGDTAIQLATSVKNVYNIKMKYAGFDLFEDTDYLQEKYPEDYKQYNLEAYPYWEFGSGGHYYSTVVEKLKGAMDTHQFKLYKGDTTHTLPQYLSTETSPVDLAYLDGCHDYEVVKSDWNNCALLFKNNPKLIVLFDDYTYEGVKAVHDEILKIGQYQIKTFNDNQFMVFLNQNTIH